MKHETNDKDQSLAVRVLTTRQEYQFLREADRKVVLIDTIDSQILAEFWPDEWQNIANYFAEIAHPDALL